MYRERESAGAELKRAPLPKSNPHNINYVMMIRDPKQKRINGWMDGLMDGSAACIGLFFYFIHKYSTSIINTGNTGDQIVYAFFEETGNVS